MSGGSIGACIMGTSADEGGTFVPGDVVWAEVKSYPWWPAVISEHEEGDQHCRHFRSWKKQYHLQFLGPYIEHQWLHATHLIPYTGVWQYKELSSSYGNRPKHEIPKRFLKAWGLAVEEADNYSEQDNSEKRTDMLIEKLTRAQEASAEGKEEKQILTACVFESHTFLLNKRSLEMVENRLAALSSKNKKLKMSIEKFKMSPSEAESLKQLSLDPENIVHITAIGNEEQQTKESEVAKIKTEADVEVNGPESTLKRSRLENAINSNRSRQSLSPVKKRLKLQNSDQLKEILIDTAVVDAIQKNGYKLKAVLKDHRKVLESVLDEFLNAKTVKKTNETSSQIVKRKAKQLLTLAEAARFLGESGQSPIKRSLDKIERQLQKERELRGETENAGPSALAKTIPVLPPEPPKPVEIVDPLKPLYSDPLLKEKVCIKCETDEKHLIGCIQCCDAYHVKCLDEDVAKAIDPKVGFTCSKCISGEKHCFSCKESLVINADDESNIFNCTISNCRKFYHTKCLEKYPGLKDLTSPEKVKNTCPQHFCASCYPNDTADNKVCYHGKIIRCLKCPVAYHSKSEDRCFPAGSVILNGHNLICPLHFPSKRSNKIRVNLNWCFFCGIGGDLILCETCPAAFHLQCAKLEEKPSDGRPWSCENCSAGLLPRYNDIVWVKCGAYRWWPARIVDPEEIPDNILRQFHEDGNFVVQFFGSHDYMWTGVGRVFLYEENDKANKDSKSSSLSQNFVKGLTEASEAFQELTIQRRENFSLKLSKSQNTNKPAPYKYVTHNIPQGDVKVMKADLETYEVCRCQKTDPDPCGLSSGCENRMTFIECHPKLCHAGEKCQNQKFAKAEYAETYYFKCGDRGWGLKNKHHLDAGQFVNEYCGDLIDYDEYNRRLKKQNERGELDFYFCFLDSKRVIDAKPKGCHSRFMNHSCDPNCEGRLWTVNGDIRVGLFARHDIPPDTELTFNYNLDSIGITDGTKKKCYCGSENCSGFIGEKPKVKQSSQPSDSDKEKKQMRKKKRGLKIKKKALEKNREEECFRCGSEGGNFVSCGKPGCLKSYHQKCVFLERKLASWYCPRHFCDTCGKNATKFCEDCDNSFCAKHCGSNIIHVSGDVWKCKDCLDGGCSSAEESFASSGKENIKKDPDASSERAHKHGTTRSSPRKSVKPFSISDDDNTEMVQIKQEAVSLTVEEVSGQKVNDPEVKPDVRKGHLLNSNPKPALTEIN